MSRRYCSVCGASHQNGGYGMCDAHLEEQETREIEERNAEAELFAQFLSLPASERWRRVFEFMRARDWDGY